MILPRLEVVAAAIIHEGKVLAARRAMRSSRRQRWEFPGGKVEPGETDNDALIREIHEELDVTVEIEEALGRSLIRTPKKVIDLRIYVVKLIEGEPKPIVHLEIRWLGLDNLRDVNWDGADVHHLKRVEELLREHQELQ